jgi:hypothetical protein
MNSDLKQIVLVAVGVILAGFVMRHVASLNTTTTAAS